MIVWLEIGCGMDGNGIQKNYDVTWYWCWDLGDVNQMNH